jgi:hypothetical protein
MSMERTPPFTPEGTAEILHELEHGSPLTPERQRTFEGMRAIRFLVDREIEMEKKKKRRA